MQGISDIMCEDHTPETACSLPTLTETQFLTHIRLLLSFFIRSESTFFWVR